MEPLEHLNTAWDVDRRIVLDSADKLVIVRFSHYEAAPSLHDEDNESSAADSSLANTDSDDDETSGKKPIKRKKLESNSNRKLEMKYHTDTLHMDELLTALAPKVRKYAKIYLVDTTKVTEFNHMYELAHDREPFAVMFFFKGEHIRVDVGTGNFNKVNFFAFESMDDFLPIVDSAYRAGMLGKTMTTTEKSFSSVSVQR